MPVMRPLGFKRTALSGRVFGTIVAWTVSKEDVPLGDAMFAILISVQTISQDQKHGLRQVWSNHGFAAVAVLTLTLGIGVKALDVGELLTND
jgi:hypothetical protein